MSLLHRFIVGAGWFIVGGLFAANAYAGSSCEYTIVERSSKPENKAFGLWVICSSDTTVGGCQLTAHCAALELHETYGTELTSVYVIPRPEYLNLGIYYAGARYSAQGRGSQPLGNRFHTIDWHWREFVVERPLTELETQIVELWVSNRGHFLSKDMASSQLYDYGALREFIASELDIEYKHAVLPKLPTKETIE